MQYPEPEISQSSGFFWERGHPARMLTGGRTAGN